MKELVVQEKTQSKKIIEKFKNCRYFSFPNYDSPTGKIIGSPYLGKSYICDGWFPKGADAVNSKIASLYYAARCINNDNLINNNQINNKNEENPGLVEDNDLIIFNMESIGFTPNYCTIFLQYNLMEYNLINENNGNILEFKYDNDVK